MKNIGFGDITKIVGFDKDLEIEIIIDSIADSLDFKDELIKVSNGYSEKYDFHISSNEKTGTNSEFKKELIDILNTFDKEDIEKYSGEVQSRIFEKNDFGVTR